MGLMNKVVLLWEEPQGWFPDQEALGFMSETECRGIYAVSLRPATGAQAIMFFLTADMARELEQETDDQLKP